MAQQVLNNNGTDTHGTQRTKINANFTELYGNVSVPSPARNLFDFKAATLRRYMDTAGNMTFNSGSFPYFVSDYIPVTVGATYQGHDEGTGLRMLFVTYFNGVGNPTGTGASNVNSVTIPSGVTHVRITGADINRIQIFQFEQAATRTKWTPYLYSDLATTFRVTDQQTAFVKRTKNLFDASMATLNAYITQTNDITQNVSDFCYSDYIPVVPGRTYYAGDGVTGLAFICYYDASKTYVAGGTQYVTGVTIPAGVYFIRFSQNFTEGTDVNDTYFVEGQPDTYQPYRFEFRSTELKKKPDQAIWGLDNLKSWNVWKNTQSTASFDIAIFGDSFVDGQYYTDEFYDYIRADGYSYGGPGFLSFSNCDSGNPLAAQSIYPAKLSASFVLAEWTTNATTSYATGGADITSIPTSAVITVTVAEALASLTIVYQKKSGGGNFRWRIGAGSWTTVSTANATTTIGTTVIDTSAAGTSFTVSIEAQAAGISFGGLIGRKSGNVLTVHKCGLTGSQASAFARDTNFGLAATPLNLKLIVLSWTTNEQNGNVAPSTMMRNIRRIITAIRTLNPLCDVLLMAPPPCKFDQEDPRFYRTSEYAEAMFHYAQRKQCAFVDLGRIFGDFAQASVDNLLFAADRIHPGTTGGKLIGATLREAIRK